MISHDQIYNDVCDKKVTIPSTNSFSLVGKSSSGDEQAEELVEMIISLLFICGRVPDRVASAEKYNVASYETELAVCWILSRP